MSDQLKRGFASAKKFNKRSVYPIDCPHPRDSREFYDYVISIQKEHGLTPDGMFGFQTFKAIQPEPEEHVLYNNVPLNMPSRSQYRLVTYDEPFSLDLHRFGQFSKRRGKIEGICVHWGGFDAQHCFNVFANGKVSSHFLIGLEKDEVVIYQVLDLAHKAWHAGSVNDWTVGVDICQQADLRWKSKYPHLSPMDNPSTRGPKQVLELDPRLATATRLFLSDLLETLHLEKKCPEASELITSPKDYTLIGHSHVSPRKWDVACWWDQIVS